MKHTDHNLSSACPACMQCSEPEEADQKETEIQTSDSLIEEKLAEMTSDPSKYKHNHSFENGCPLCIGEDSDKEKLSKGETNDELQRNKNEMCSEFAHCVAEMDHPMQHVEPKNGDD